MKQDMIVILDLGSHENTVLARAIRALGVYSEIYPHDITVEELKALPNVKGIIINGGPNNVIDGVAIDVNPGIYALGTPRNGRRPRQGVVRGKTAVSSPTMSRRSRALSSLSCSILARLRQTGI